MLANAVLAVGLAILISHRELAGGAAKLASSKLGNWLAPLRLRSDTANCLGYTRTASIDGADIYG